MACALYLSCPRRRGQLVNALRGQRRCRASTARRNSGRQLSTCSAAGSAVPGGRCAVGPGGRIRLGSGRRQPARPRVQLRRSAATPPCWYRGHDGRLAPRRLGPVDHGHPCRVGEPEHGRGDHARRHRPTGRTRDRRRSRADRPADVDGAVDRAAVGVRRHLSHPSPSTPKSTVCPSARTFLGLVVLPSGAETLSLETTQPRCACQRPAARRRGVKAAG
jgi:hypothetical protein